MKCYRTKIIWKKKSLCKHVFLNHSEIYITIYILEWEYFTLQCFVWFTHNMYIMNKMLVQFKFICCYVMICDHINYCKCINNILAWFFPYFLFYIKPDTVNIIISCITNFHYIHQFTFNPFYFSDSVGIFGSFLKDKVLYYIWKSSHSQASVWGNGSQLSENRSKVEDGLYCEHYPRLSGYVHVSI